MREYVRYPRFNLSSLGSVSPRDEGNKRDDDDDDDAQTDLPGHCNHHSIVGWSAESCRIPQ
jgi:hypothetical protein